MSKYTIEIDYEIADKIFLDVLKEDYLMLCKEIWYIKSSNEGKVKDEYLPHIKEDYENNYNFVIAMEQLFYYYMNREEANRLIQTGTDIRYGNQTA